MKSLPLKLGIGIVVLFGLVLLGFVLYEPLWWKWYEARLDSNDMNIKEKAADTIASCGRSIMPRIKRWLKSDNERNIARACLVLEKTKGEVWKKTLQELTKILHGKPSEKTDAVSRLIWKKDWNGFLHDKTAGVNIEAFHLLHHYNSKARMSSAKELGYSGNVRAVNPLIKALNNDRSYSVREFAAEALCRLRDSRAIGPLIFAMNNDPDNDVRWKAALCLSFFNGSNVESALVESAENNNNGAIIVMAWQFGGKYIDSAMNIKFEDKHHWINIFRADALARWGNSSMLGLVIEDLLFSWPLLQSYHEDVISRMPHGFSGIDFNANIRTYEKQIKTIEAWYAKHKQDLAWDAEKRRYFLKSENKAGKKE